VLVERVINVKACTCNYYFLFLRHTRTHTHTYDVNRVFCWIFFLVSFWCIRDDTVIICTAQSLRISAVSSVVVEEAILVVVEAVLVLVVLSPDTHLHENFGPKLFLGDQRYYTLFFSFHMYRLIN